MIPKIIHCCWFGRNPLTPQVNYLISTWRKFCPDYEIRLWNEDNFNVNENAYCREAYAAKKWAFVSDYFRLKVLYEYGGIYMDTDVEVVKSLDELLKYNAFSGYESPNSIPTGTMGAVAKNEWIAYLLEDYNNRHFILPDGLDMTTNVQTITRLTVQKYELDLDGTKKIFGNNMAILPFEYLCAKEFASKKVFRTENTFTIHHFAGSWVSWNVVYPFDATNRWATAYKRIAWKNLSDKYGKLFERIKAPFDPFNLFIGMLLLQDKYNFSDDEMLQQFAENKYFQYFCGIWQALHTPPFDARLLAYLHECCPKIKLMEIKLEILKDCPDLAEILL